MRDSRAMPVPDGVAGMRVDAGVARILGLSRTVTAQLAEDGDINREIMEVLLTGMGVACIPAVNGQEALDIWRQRHKDIDLILMDVQMPVMDGHTATRQIRASGLPGAATVPIVAMTAYAMRGDAGRSLEAGMNAHLTKPVDMGALIRTLKESLFGNGGQS